MTNVGSTFSNVGTLDHPAVGSGASSIGGSLFVLNEDATTISGSTTLATDPYHAVYGTNTAAWRSNIRPINVPDMGYWLELNIAYYGTAPTADQPRVAVFGKVPWDKQKDSKRLWPQDINSNLTPTADLGSTAYDDAFWVPLVDWDNYEVQTDTTEVDANALIALNPDAVVAVDSDGGDATGIRMGVPRRVYLAGCKQVICTIETVANNATAAVITGRFIG
tara:strand:+ start:1124 stop:1786 length:663 start_codon:yes stop_codon:yes gene_type:complete